MTRAVAAVIVAAIAAGPAAAAPPAARVDAADFEPARVKPVVDRLGSPDFRVREEAGRALAALGERALPALKAALPAVVDAEASRRLQVIVERLELDRLRSARRVTLTVADKSPRFVIEEIERQTGYRLKCDYTGPDKVRFTFAWVAVPFWEAVDRLCDATGLVVGDPGDDSGLVLSHSDVFNPHVSYDGPFKVTASTISGGRTVQLGGLNRRQPNLPQPEFLNLNLMIQAEPKAPIVGVGTAVVVKAVDNKGGSLQPAGDGGDGGPVTSFYLPGSGVGFRSYNTNFGLNLARPDRAGTAIRELRGQVPVSLLSETRPEITVPNPLAVKKTRFPGRSVDLDVIAADFQNDLLTVDLSFRRRAGDPDDYSWLGTLAQRVEVADAAGVKFRSTGVTNQNNSPNVCTMQLQFVAQGDKKKAGKPARLEFVEWVTVTRDVTFTFKDLPLP